MAYYEQVLQKWVLNQQFNSINNCRIGNPTWNKFDSYSKEFYIYKRDPIEEEFNLNGNIVDTQIIEWVEYVLVKNSNTIKIMYKTLTWYEQLWNTKTITSTTPLRLIKWYSARWVEKAIGIRIWDAFFAIHNKWTYDPWTTYLSNDVVEYSWEHYVSLQWSIWVLPTDTTKWKVYDTTNSWMTKSDPDTINYNDVFKNWYLVLKLEYAWINSLVDVWDFIYFYEDKSNLQWIAAEIQYIKVIDSSNILVYIPSTNKTWTTPLYDSDPLKTEKVWIYKSYWESPIIATDDWVYIYNVTTSWTWVITWTQEVKLITLSNITDICYYNGNICVLNNQRFYYSNTTNQWHSNVNFYPLDFIPIRWWVTLTPFGKMLVLLWLYNKIITPINDIDWNLWYISSDLNFEESLFYKYSIKSYMWSLYMIKQNKEIVKVNIISINNIDYQLEEEKVLDNTKWLLDDLNWEVYMCIDDKELHILNHRWWNTYDYVYNLEYGHWNVNQYECLLFKIEKWKYYWDRAYKVWWDEEFEQSISWVIWTENLHTLKTIMYTKIVFWIESEKLEYFLDIQYEIGWYFYEATIDLSNYPININLNNIDLWLWDSFIWDSILWLNISITQRVLWTFFIVNVWIGRTCGLMRFKLRSRLNNWFVYWWSIQWFTPLQPEVTEQWNKH